MLHNGLVLHGWATGLYGPTMFFSHSSSMEQITVLFYRQTWVTEMCFNPEVSSETNLPGCLCVSVSNTLQNVLRIKKWKLKWQISHISEHSFETIIIARNYDMLLKDTIHMYQKEWDFIGGNIFRKIFQGYNSHRYVLAVNHTERIEFTSEQTYKELCCKYLNRSSLEYFYSSTRLWSWWVGLWHNPSAYIICAQITNYCALP